jgi:hypothetical protein
MRAFVDAWDTPKEASTAVDLDPAAKYRDVEAAWAFFSDLSVWRSVTHRRAASALQWAT